MYKLLVSSALTLTLVLPAEATRRPRVRKSATLADNIVERVIVPDGRNVPAPLVTARVGQVTAVHTHSAVRRITFGDDTCLTPKESDPGTPAFVAYLQPLRPCPVQNVFIETSDGVTELNLITVKKGAFTREVRIASGRAENTIAMQRAEIESLQNRQAKLNDDLKNARAAADEAVRQIPRAKQEGVKEGIGAGLTEGAQALAAIGDKPHKSPVMITAQVKVSQLGVWSEGASGLWGRFEVSNRTRAEIVMNVEIEGGTLLKASRSNVAPLRKQTIALLVATEGKNLPVVRFTVGGQNVASK